MNSLINIEAVSLPEAWEKAVLSCWQNGKEFTTEYDKPGDPKSKDCIASILVKNPFAESRIHKAIPCGLEDLEIYRQEVLYGIHDNWINPKKGAWSYTYAERIFKYKTPDGQVFDQIQMVIDRLSETPYTRRAQAVTWKVWEDNFWEDPACLQRLWFRIEEVNGIKKLNCHVSMRSNDAFKASFMNMFAFTALQKMIAEKISEKIGEKVEVGYYHHFADSFHIYGSYFNDFEKFIDRCSKTEFSSRVINSEDVQYMFDSGKITLLNNTQSEILIPIEDYKRLYLEIPEDRQSEVTNKRMWKFVNEGK